MSATVLELGRGLASLKRDFTRAEDEALVRVIDMFADVGIAVIGESDPIPTGAVGILTPGDLIRLAAHVAQGEPVLPKPPKAAPKKLADLIGEQGSIDAAFRKIVSEGV